MPGSVRALLAALMLVCASALTACGADDDDARTLTWFIFNEPSGAPQEIAQRCSEESGGRYRIDFQFLPSDADGQREQLVRRLGAEDSSIDLVGMDVIWTGEFANAGWLEEFTGSAAEAVSDGVLEGPLESARFEDRLYAAPIWSNTQLLWYRTDLVDEAPETWDDMIEEAERLAERDEPSRVQVQADRYEGLTVWINAMVESAGASFLEGPEEVSLEEEPTKRALSVMGRLSRTPGVADPGITTSNEDSARLSFEAETSAFMLNYPFVYPSAEGNAPDVFENMGAAIFPRVDPDRESAPPLGGINLGVSKFSRSKDLAFEAVECLVQPENQVTVTELGGLPPVSQEVYDEEEIRDAYPGFADLIRDSIENAVPRPATSPAYQDLTLGIQRAVHPTTDIDPDDPSETYEALRDRVEQAVKREGLL